MTPEETALRELLMRLRDVHPDDLSPSVRRLRAAWIDTGCYGIDPNALRIEGAETMLRVLMREDLDRHDPPDPATVVREAQR